MFANNFYPKVFAALVVKTDRWSFFQLISHQMCFAKTLLLSSMSFCKHTYFVTATLSLSSTSFYIGLVWSGLVRSGAVWYGLVWCGVV